MWSLGGLEQPLLAALLAWAAYFGIRWTSKAKENARDADVIGVLLGLAVLSRADAALFTALFYAGAVLADGVRTRTLIARARLLPIPVLFFAGQELFRHFYYGAWVPNTAHVKVAFTLHRLYTGLRYEVYGVRSEFIFLVLALVGCIALWIAGKRRQVIFLGDDIGRVAALHLGYRRRHLSVVPALCSCDGLDGLSGGGLRTADIERAVPVLAPTGCNLPDTDAARAHI